MLGGCSMVMGNVRSLLLTLAEVAHGLVSIFLSCRHLHGGEEVGGLGLAGEDSHVLAVLLGHHVDRFHHVSEFFLSVAGR